MTYNASVPETEEVNQENKDIKDWADRLVPCDTCKGGEKKEYLENHWCPRCGRLHENIPIILHEKDTIRVYDKRNAVLAGCQYMATKGDIRILVFPDDKWARRFDISMKCAELFARPIKLSDDNQRAKEEAT